MNTCDHSDQIVRRCEDSVLPGRERPTPLPEVQTFVPGLVEHSLAQSGLPTRRELAIVFVDIADSTRMVVRQSPEVALATVQRFMRLVTEIALAHCGDVKDCEGDGALLYFGSIVQAALAALAIRTALGEEQQPGNLPVQARLSVHVGDVIIGEIGSPLRRSVAIIGPAVSLAARLLKHIPPRGRDRTTGGDRATPARRARRGGALPTVRTMSSAARIRKRVCDCVSHSSAGRPSPLVSIGQRKFITV